MFMIGADVVMALPSGEEWRWRLGVVCDLKRLREQNCVQRLPREAERRKRGDLRQSWRTEIGDQDEASADTKYP